MKYIRFNLRKIGYAVNVNYECYTTDGRMFIVQCKSDGWSKNNLTNNYKFTSSFPVDDGFNDCDITSEKLESCLNGIIEKVNDLQISDFEEDDVKKILICLPMIVGEMMTDETMSIRMDRLKRLSEKYNLKEDIFKKVIDLKMI